MKAVLNEIDGFDHSGAHKVGVPAIFGMNFQSVSTAQKLPASDGLKGGYTAEGVPGPLLAKNLDYVDAQVAALVSEIRKQHLDSSTTVILSAKHGQSPTDPAALTRIDDGAMHRRAQRGLEGGPSRAPATSSAHSVDDDAMLLWLTDRSQAAADFAKAYLLRQSGTGNDIDGAPKAFTASGLSAVHAGADAAHFLGAKPGDSRVPDIIGVAQYGVVYTGGQSKIAEHGGDVRRRPRRPDRRVGRGRGARGARRRGRRDHPDRADHPERCWASTRRRCRPCGSTTPGCCPRRADPPWDRPRPARPPQGCASAGERVRAHRCLFLKQPSRRIPGTGGPGGPHRPRRGGAHPRHLSVKFPCQ